MKLSPALMNYKKNEGIEKFFLPYGDQTISLPKKFLPDKSFLRYHHENVFRI
jgi:hypothetical protein